jgi:hypothetical protein
MNSGFEAAGKPERMPLKFEPYISKGLKTILDLQYLETEGVLMR